MDSNPEEDFRSNPEYKDAYYTFIELTMSCNKEEAIASMLYWMENAIAYGIVTKNVDWMDKFLAADDLFNSLCAGI